MKTRKAAPNKKMIKLRGERTQKEVAADLKMSLSSYAMIEAGHRAGRDEVKKKIAAYYGTTVDELFFA